ncbi:MAG: hypothetical protein J4F28_05050 [Nitrosopumilaceae archaeon]|nr:hypothetical protein [Nitrosopumilaceae archaeon]
MKDYDQVIVWLDYFNKNLKKSRGRRLGLARCVFDPSFKEMSDAATEAGLDIAETSERARFPKRPYVKSGYISLPKAGKTKGAILDMISKKLVAKRAAKSKKKKQQQPDGQKP